MEIVKLCFCIYLDKITVDCDKYNYTETQTNYIVDVSEGTRKQTKRVLKETVNNLSVYRHEITDNYVLLTGWFINPDVEEIKAKAIQLAIKQIEKELKHQKYLYEKRLAFTTDFNNKYVK